MKKKTVRRAAAKAAPASRKKAPARRTLVLKPEAITPDEVTHIESVVKRFEESEKAWQRMTAAPEEGDPWTSVEEHLLAKRDDSERRWKFFSK